MLPIGPLVFISCSCHNSSVNDIEAIIVQFFGGRTEVDVVALFGSAARGRAQPDSDLDLYVRLRLGARWTLAERLALTADLSAAVRREIDLIVEDESTSVILRREVANHGRPLFEARLGAWTDLRAAASLAYSDLEPYLRRIGEAVRLRARAHG